MDYSLLDDNELVELTIKEDKEKYRYIVGRYQNKLFAYIFRLINHREEAAEIAQEVFLKAYKNLKGFNRKKKFSSWIYRIAHNEAVNWLKKNSRYKKRYLDDENNPLDIADDADLEEMADQDDEAKKLKECLNRLPDKYKNVLILKYFEEKSYEEMSLILRKSKNAVGILVNRAKKKLSDIYEE
ncbi:MAG TPA: RNA polymerase sigma factor [Candidatus Bipolaricaulota bacterium]|nr:RNA polymerase sigma factor [Candidatus Bipolaricaulota bacterium]